MNSKSIGSSATRAAMRAAFWQLFQQKPVAQITVKEITALAGYNRSTFYQYYSDVYSVLEEIENLILDTVSKTADFISARANEMSFLDILNALIIYSPGGKNKYLSNLLARSDSARFERLLIARIKELFERLFTWTGIDENRKQLIMEYHINGILGILKYSVRQGREPSASELIDTLSVITGQPVSALTSEPFAKRLQLSLAGWPIKPVEKS